MSQLPPSTQVCGKIRKSTIKYDYVILFVWDVNRRKPFFLRPISSLDKNMFPMSLISGALTQDSRKNNKFEMDHLIVPSTYFTLFCKVEKGKWLQGFCRVQVRVLKYLRNPSGTEFSRIEEIVFLLNKSYCDKVQAQRGSSIADLYDQLLKQYSYRLLAKFDYDWAPKKISRVYGNPDLTDVCFYFFSV